MILVCDNYDSFTYNLVQYLGSCGSKIIVKRNDEIRAGRDFEELEEKISGIVISPGPGRPEDAGVSMDLINCFYKEIPVLGICLGHQCLGAVFGGKIDYAPDIYHGKTSMINHNGSDLFAGIPNPLEATRYHSLVVSREGLPHELEITAETGSGEVMALKHCEFPVYGLQFHPESILTPEGMAVIKNFVEVCCANVEFSSEYEEKRRDERRRV